MAVLVDKCTETKPVAAYQNDPNMNQFVTPEGHSKASQSMDVAYPWKMGHPSEVQAAKLQEWKK